MLLAVNVGLNVRDANGNTALLEAARGGHEEVITALMSRGARLNMDPQHLAQVLCGTVTRCDMAQLANLLRCGADANVVDYDKRAPLHIAAAEGNLQAVRGTGRGAGAAV
jgi:ankyrin repeat protein